VNRRKSRAGGSESVPFSAGAGALGLSFCRLVLLHLYPNNLVWHAWEEITELLFILGVALVLWIFRESLLKESH
jgi:hypothetical protein